MYYFYTFLFCLLYFLIFLNKNSELASENASSISESKSTINGDDADPTYLITGGYRPKKHILAKYVVSIRYKRPPKYRDKKYFGIYHFCGGSILNPKLILTAAHCLKTNGSNLRGSSLEVVAGTPKRLVKTEHTQIIKIAKVIVHKDYDEEIIYCDIGLLKLKSSIQFDDTYAQAIPLPDVPVLAYAKCVTLGWGYMFLTGPLPNEILYADLTVFPENVCRERIASFFAYEICGINLVNQAQHNSPGDSGGPLICDGTVIGVVSFWSGKAHLTVYTDVFEFLDWITKSKYGKQRKPLWLLLLLSLTWTIIFV